MNININDIEDRSIGDSIHHANLFRQNENFKNIPLSFLYSPISIGYSINSCLTMLISTKSISIHKCPLKAINMEKED